MSSTTVLTYKSVTSKLPYTEMNSMDGVDPNDGKALQEQGRHFIKFEVKANENQPAYFIHMNPFVITKDLLKNMEPDDFIQQMQETLEGHVKVDMDVLNRFRSGLKPMLEAANKDQTLVLWKNGFFGYASSNDKILKNGQILNVPELAS